jgi:molecular chaperone DnaK (HSP70)
MTSYSWIKLCLDDETKLTDYDDLSLAGLSVSQGEGMMVLPLGKTAAEVCADYLDGVYNYTMSELKRTRGEAIVNVTPIDFWVTVPATWSDKAKSPTKRAATTAGFASRIGDRMYLINEPEAAAIATLIGLVGEGVDNQLHPGDGSKYLMSGV